jgi:hypothetical protein
VTERAPPSNEALVLTALTSHEARPARRELKGRAPSKPAAAPVSCPRKPPATARLPGGQGVVTAPAENPGTDGIEIVVFDWKSLGAPTRQ